MPRHPSPVEQNQAIGESEAFVSLQERISEAAKTDRPIIFIGERGTGKELAASRLHLLSTRWNKPYITLNCAALSPTLIESELFGHEAGAFTGAMRLRRGRFEMADGGSLFLDEVANIPMTVQEKILRVVEYGQMERVGSSSSMQVDARLIAATNADLRMLAREGRFRQDLLDRLSFEVITLPPLRERREDILVLAGHFARRMAAELGREEPPVFSEHAETALLEHAWPGNVRQLKNVVERMVYRSAGATIEQIVFDPFESPYAQALSGENSTTSNGAGTEDSEGSEPARARGSGLFEHELGALPLEEAVRTLETERIRRALEASQFNQRKAAERLGLSYHQFRGYYRKYRDELTEED